MEQRFTRKDFFLFASLAALWLTVLLSMYMVDRQWSKMDKMERVMAEQAGDLRGLREHLRNSGAQSGVARDATAQEQNAGDTVSAFRRAASAAQMQDYAAGDWLVLAFGTGLKTLTPLVSSDVYAAEVQSYVQESLLARDPESLEWQGLIARSWQVGDKGLRITFQLRDDVRFSDGKPLTARDVAFTFAFIMDPRIAAPRQRAYFEKIESVTATGDYEVVFKFKEPYFESLDLAGGLPIMPEHFYAPYLEKPEDFNQSKGLLIGSGPYRLSDPKSWAPDKGIVELERDPRYWGPLLPPFERVIWKVIENDSARLTTFRNGDIDLYSARPREYKGLQQDKAITAHAANLEYMSAIAGYSYIAWNQHRAGKPTRFADSKVRLAMTYLTDRKRIIDEIYLGYGDVAVSPFSPRSKQHDPAIEPYSHDVDKARMLLREAGYEDRNGDGVLEDAQGTRFEFELVYFQSNEETQRMVLLLKDLYARVGIVMHPTPSEWPIMQNLIDKKNFDAITLGWSSGVETDIYQIFHSKQSLTGGDNYVSYANAELDRLIEQARATVDEAQRMPLWRQAERILHADQPYTFLMRRKSLVFIDRRIKNVEVTPLGINDFLPVEWYVPQAQQKHVN